MSALPDQEKRLDPDALIPIRDLVNEAKRLAINAGAEVWADLAEAENWLDEAISRGAQTPMSNQIEPFIPPKRPDHLTSACARPA